MILPTFNNDDRMECICTYPTMMDGFAVISVHFCLGWRFQCSQATPRCGLQWLCPVCALSPQMLLGAQGSLTDAVFGELLDANAPVKLRVTKKQLVSYRCVLSSTRLFKMVRCTRTQSLDWLEQLFQQSSTCRTSPYGFGDFWRRFHLQPEPRIQHMC